MIKRIVPVTVVVVGPRDSASWCSVSVSAGYSEEPAAADVDARRNAALPWNWAWTTVAPKVWTIDAQDHVADLQNTVKFHDAVLGATAPATVVTAIERDWFAGDLELTVLPAPYVSGQQPKRRLTDQLAHLATHLGAVPQQLGLVRYLDRTTLPAGRLLIAPGQLEQDVVPAPAGPTKVGDHWELDYQKPGGEISTVWLHEIEDALPHSARPSLWIDASFVDESLELVAEKCRQATLVFARMRDFVRQGGAGRQSVDLLVGALAYYAATPSVDARATLDTVAQAEKVRVTLPGAGFAWKEVVAKALEVTELTQEALLAIDASGDEALQWLLASSDPANATTLADPLKNAVNQAVRPATTPDQPLGCAARRREQAAQLTNAARDVVLPDHTIIPKELAIAAWLANTFDPLCARVGLAADPAVRAAWHAYCGAFSVSTPQRSADTAKPHPLILKIDDVAADPDRWRYIAGVGVLLRSHAKNKWRLVNLARVAAADDSEILREVLVPSRLPVRDGVWHPYVEYDSRSLVAHNPLDHAFTDNPTQAGASGVDAHYTYEQLETPNDDSLLPQLVFGDTFDAAVFAIDLAGGMPSELTDTVPWQLRRPLQLPDAGAGAVPVKTTSLKYLRRVPIGPLQVKRIETNQGEDVPAGVAPIARELPENDSRDAPLIVRRADATVAFTCNVVPPAVDIDLLERWVGVQNAKGARRRTLIKLPPDPPPPAPPRNIDEQSTLAFADPAVTHLLISISRCDLSKPFAPPVWQQLVTHRRLPFTIGPDGAATPVPVRFTFGQLQQPTTADQSLDLDAAGPLLPHLFRIELAALVPDTAAARCAPGVYGSKAIRGQDSDGTAWSGYKVCARTFLVERASEQLPDATSLFQQFAVDVQDRDVTVTLAPGANLWLYRTIGGAEVLRHPWRWLGRPLRWFEPACPELAQVIDRTRVLSPPGEKPTRRVRDWEADAFHPVNKDPTEFPYEMQCVPVSHFHLTRANAVTVLTDRRTALAEYVRYSLRVTSRYQAIWTGDTASVLEAREHVTDDDGNTRRLPGWRALFLPSEDQNAVQATPPVIKAVLPLTRTVPDAGTPANQPPSVLVVVDEPAYRTYGISESLIAELVSDDDHFQISAGTTPEPRTAKLIQYGRDPILTVETAAPPTVRLDLDGPYGFTNEPKSPEPLFTASCYVLSPPAGIAQAWDFAKVRFRRSPAPECSVPEPAKPSPWTEPVWLQFASASDTLVPEPPFLENGALAGDVLKVVAPSRSDMFAYYAVVSARVYSFDGNDDNEFYLETRLIDPHQPIVIDPWAAPNGVFVRVVEVQLAQPAKSATTRIATPPDPDQLWKSLLPTAANGDLHVRITRVSPRLEAKTKQLTWDVRDLTRMS